MKKIAFALALIAISSTASAVPVVLVSHSLSSGFVFTDGRLSLPPDFVTSASTATWDWDGTNLTSTGLYSATNWFGDIPFPGTTGTVLNDQVMGLSVDTGSATASATSYTCLEGFLGPRNDFSVCGDYLFGPNGVDDSTTIWGPGTAVSQTLGGDDLQGPGSGPRSISAYNFGLDGIIGVDGMTVGDQILIGNGIPLGMSGSVVMAFQVVVPVPASAWLFGSALGLMSWMRRKTT